MKIPWVEVTSAALIFAISIIARCCPRLLPVPERWVDQFKDGIAFVAALAVLFAGFRTLSENIIVPPPTPEAIETATATISAATTPVVLTAAPTPSSTTTSTSIPASATPTPSPAFRSPTPTPCRYAGLALTAPVDGFSYTLGDIQSGQALLQWQGVSALCPGDHYLLHIHHRQGDHWQILDAPTFAFPDETLVELRLESGLRWRAAVCTGGAQGSYGQQPCQLASPWSEERWVQFDLPPKPTVPDGGG